MNEELSALVNHMTFEGSFNSDDILYFELKSPNKIPITFGNLLSAFSASSIKIQRKLLSDFRIELELLKSTSTDTIDRESFKLLFKNMYLKLIIANERKE